METDIIYCGELECSAMFKDCVKSYIEENFCHLIFNGMVLREKINGENIYFIYKNNIVYCWDSEEDLPDICIANINN